MCGIWIKRFRIFASRATSTPEKASVAIMTSLPIHNLLILKSRGSYTPKGPADEIQNNGSLLLVTGYDFVKEHN